MQGQGLLFFPSETEHLAQIQFRPHILGVWSGPDGVGSVLIGWHERIEEAHDITRKVQRKAHVMICGKRNGGRVCGIIKGAARSQIEMVQIGHEEEGVGGHEHDQESRIHGKQPGDIGPHGRELIEKAFPPAASVGEGR